jgi:ABC-type nitrate/sulfonate/bicarbonate transport system substrate-binding protein
MTRCAGLRAAVACTLVVLAAAVCRPVRAAETVSFGITSTVAFSLAHYIAAEKQFYAAENLRVDTFVVGAAAGVLHQLAAGSLNVAQAATDQSLRAILHGAPIRIVAGAAADAPFRLIAARTIASFGDLKGKTISVGGTTDVTLYFLRVMARRNGLADRDYDLIYGGGTPNRFAQLASGAVAAAILTNPVDFTAIAQGFSDLGSVTNYLPHWAQNNILVDSRWAAQHRGAVVALLRARIRATRFFYDPANRGEVIAILVKATRTAPSVAAATYDLYTALGVIARDAALSPDGIAANFAALVALGDIATPPPLAGFIDASFLGEAPKP